MHTHTWAWYLMNMILHKSIEMAGKTRNESHTYIVYNVMVV